MRFFQSVLQSFSVVFLLANLIGSILLPSSGFAASARHAHRGAGSTRVPSRHHHSLSASVTTTRELGPPREQAILGGVVQPAQWYYEARQVCRRGGVDPGSRANFYTSVTHLSCAAAKGVIRQTPYGSGEIMGKYYECDNFQVPEIAIYLSSDEDMLQHIEPDGAECPDHWVLQEEHLNTRDGDCFVGWRCEANAGGQ